MLKPSKRRNLPMTFGEKLFKLRKEKGLSQEQLAPHGKNNPPPSENCRR